MRNMLSIATIATTLAASALAISAPCAKADTAIVYDFDFHGTGSDIIGQWTVLDGQIIAFSGTAFEETIYQIAPNPNFPNPTNSQNQIYWDNAFSATAPYLDSYGVAFLGSSFFGTLPFVISYDGNGIYTEHVGLYGDIFLQTGTLTVTQAGVSAVPEPSTWALMLAGFAGLGFAGWRQRKTAVAAA